MEDITMTKQEMVNELSKSTLEIDRKIKSICGDEWYIYDICDDYVDVRHNVGVYDNGENKTDGFMLTFFRRFDGETKFEINVSSRGSVSVECKSVDLDYYKAIGAFVNSDEISSVKEMFIKYRDMVEKFRKDINDNSL